MPTDSNAAVAAQGPELVITRTFKAPRALVFRAFSEAERLAQWWGPKGCAIHVASLNFRPGGDFHYRMSFPGGHEMWGRFIFREIVAPERIVWVNTFSDPDGNLVKPPFDMAVPPEILNTVNLEERGGQTMLTLRAWPINETAEQRATFEGMFDSLHEGYGGTWD